MASQLDLLFDAADKSSVTQTRTSGVVSGATTLNAEGSAFTLTSPPPSPFAEGQRVLVYDGVIGLAYCHVKKVTSSTNITLLPIQSASDSVVLPYLFPNGSAITVIEEVAAQQVIDLSEASEDAVDYLVVGCGAIEHTANPGDVDVYMRLMALQDDPFSGSAGYGACRVTLNGSNPDRMNFVAAAKLSLAGGQRYENYIGFNGPSGVVTTMSSPRILAVRVTGGYFAGDGKTAEQTTTDTTYTGSHAAHLDLGADLPAGTYLIVSTWALGSNSGIASDCALEVDGSTTLANQNSTPSGASNYIPGGFMGIVTLGATNRVRLVYKSIGGFTCRIKNAFLCAVPIANIPAFAGVHVSQDLSNDLSQSVATNDFVAIKTSGAVTLQSGRHIEIVSASVGGDAPYRSRPNYGAAGAGLGAHNVLFGAGAAAYVPTFWFIRNRRDAGSTTAILQMRRNTAVTTLLKARDFTFSWLREQPDFRPLPKERMAVVADIELGALILKNWNSTTVTGRFSHRLPASVRHLARVPVNGSGYTRASSLGAMTNGTWFWDAGALDVYVQLSTAHQAIGTGAPSDSGITVAVVPLLLVSRETDDLIDPWSGSAVRYRPLLKAVPGCRQSIRSNQGKFTTGSSIGELRLNAAHGEFDDQLGRPYSGYRVKLRRGYTRQTKRLSDFEVFADAVLGPPSGDLETLSLRLLDRRRLLQTPVAKTRITVREGFGADARSREGQFIPVIWGEVLRQVAYRITNDETAGGWNEYQFVDHAVKSIDAVYLDGTTHTKVVVGKIDVTATYSGLGKVRVKNDAHPDSTKPPDKVFVSFVGRTSNGLTTGVALRTFGAIARDLAITYGGSATTRLLERMFRMLDRGRWRWQQVPSVGRRPLPPKVALIATESMNVEQALSKLCADGLLFWFVNHQDRIGIDIPDFDRGQLVRNGGFEDDLWPWTVKDSATLVATTSRKYRGNRSAEISNGAPVNTVACAAQNITLPGGQHAVTLVASLLEGTPDAFRIGVVGPSGVETLSDPITLETGKWIRVSVVYESEPGDAGHTELRLYPAHGSSVATRVAVDEVEAYRIAAVLDQVQSTPAGFEYEEEHYNQGEAPYAVNQQNTQQVSTRTVNESEARGLSAAIKPEGEFAIPSSSSLMFPTLLAADADSAGGVAAAGALQYSRGRMVCGFRTMGMRRMPIVGDYVFHRNNPRVPELADNYPIWRICDVGWDDANAAVIKIKVRRPVDNVYDRIDIAPDGVPMGAILPTRSPGAITDHAEVTELRDQFVMGARTPSISTQRGSLFHRHPLSHRHVVPVHDHDATPQSHDPDSEGAAGLFWPVEYDGPYTYPAPVGPQEPVNVSRGLADGGHPHSIPTSPEPVDPASGESSVPNTAIETSPGPNVPSFRRVRFMQRTANTVATISPDLRVGFRTANLPAGWIRDRELDGLWLRGVGTLGPLSTTTTGTFTPNDAGSTLALTSGTGAVVGRRLEVTKSGSTVHVVITVASGANPTVVPLHETNDVANGSFPTGGSATVTADSQLLVRTNVATSTYTPNDAGSTLKVASASGISIGSLLQVIATNDAFKFVHVRVTAVSGTDLTVVPLHLPGDQANSYAGFTAGAARLVVDSEYIAPTHKHGGLMPVHEHEDGGHPHGPAEFITGPATETEQAQKQLGGASEEIGIAAVDGHQHLFRISAPPDNADSGPAGGTITGDAQPTPEYFEVVWAYSDGNQTSIPAGGLVLWAQSGIAPGGWGKVGAARNLLLKGAPSGQGPGSSSENHGHVQNNAAHSMPHDHGGVVIQPSEKPDGGIEVIDGKAGADDLSVAAGAEGTQGGHAHPIHALLEMVDPGLAANSHPTGAATNGLPLHRQIVLIEKQ